MSEPQPLVLSGISHAYGDHQVWTNLSLSVGAGEFVALVGESGSGKTTLLRAIAGLICPQAGTIAIGGISVFKHGENTVPCEARGVGLVFQEYALFPHMSVRENVAYGLREPNPDRIESLLSLVGISPDLGDRRPSQLSGGQQQRVALARALAPRPALLLLDEPFSNVDAGRRAALGNLLHRITSEEGASVLMVTHDHQAAMSLSDRMIVLGSSGRGVVQDAPPLEVYRRPASAGAAEMTGRCTLVNADVQGGMAATTLGTIPVCIDEDGYRTLMMRPEGLKFIAEADGPLTVSAVQFAGAHHVLSCDYKEGQIEILWSSQEAPPAPGTRGSLETTTAAWAIPSN